MYAWWSYLGLIACVCITLAGIFGNTVTLVVLLKIKKFRNTIGAFIFSLTLANFALSAITIPTNLPYLLDTSEHGLMNETLCYFLKIICYGAALTSWLLIGLITLNRTIQICCQAFVYNKMFSKTATAAMILASWLYGFGFVILEACGIGGKIVTDDKKCELDLIEFSFVYFFTLGAVMVLMLTCYAIILIYVYKNTSSGCSNRNTFHRLEKMILVTTVAFVICYVPPILYNLLLDSKNKAEKDENSAHLLIFIFYLPIYLSAIINPIIYCLLSSQYMEAYKDLLCCKKMEKNIPAELSSI